MSDIPDWLVELAAQSSGPEGDDGEPAGPPPSDETSASSEVSDVMDALDVSEDDLFEFASEPLIFTEVDEPAQDFAEVTPTAIEPETEAELMDALRSQVEADDLGEIAEPDAPRRALNIGIPGLLPWQQLVLAVLLFLDVVVIGLLFLVMLGRISLG